MRSLIPAVVSAALMAATVSTAQPRTRFFLAGGLTGTSDHAFQGGWGGTIGLERPIAPAGALVVRVDGSTLPSTPDRLAFFPAGPASFGESGPGQKDATLLSLMAGLRLTGQGVARTYLDALVGIGYAEDPFYSGPAVPYPALYPTPVPESRGHINLAFSVGPGIEVRVRPSLGLFAEVHYDFYTAEGADTPVVPVRFGMIVR